MSHFSTQKQCRYGESCHSLSGGKPCKFDHTIQQETLMLREKIQYMKEQAQIHRHVTHVPCAIQHSRHSYSKEGTQTVYTTVDGTEVYLGGKPIDETIRFSNAHYGAMGQSHGGLERQSILKSVRELYYRWYKEHEFKNTTAIERIQDIIPDDGLFERPAPLESFMTYCGN